jgi:hypothetical protein
MSYTVFEDSFAVNFEIDENIYDYGLRSKTRVTGLFQLITSSCVALRFLVNDIRLSHNW